MPFYEYECPHCHFKDEVLQMISEKPLKKCPSCGKPGIKKLVSAPVFRLKGSGWYETDFKSDKENKRNLAGEDKEQPKSETKPDAKPDKAADAAPAKSESAKAAPANTAARKPVAKPRAKPARPTKRVARR